jgi:hypothetical protein
MMAEVLALRELMPGAASSAAPGIVPSKSNAVAMSPRWRRARSTPPSSDR